MQNFQSYCNKLLQNCNQSHSFSKRIGNPIDWERDWMHGNDWIPMIKTNGVSHILTQFQCD